VNEERPIKNKTMEEERKQVLTKSCRCKEQGAMTWRTKGGMPPAWRNNLQNAKHVQFWLMVDQYGSNERCLIAHLLALGLLSNIWRIIGA
jgi:hypothetical protein